MTDDVRQSDAYRKALAEVHQAQDHRIAMIALGNANLGIARILVKLDRRNTPAACGKAMCAVELYQRAGLSRAAAAAWRWARFAHRARWREEIPADTSRAARWVTRPPSGRQLELAWAVDRITRERGRPPSWRELAQALRIRTANARQLAERCREKGIVEFDDNVPRSIRATWRWPAKGGPS